MKVGAGKGEILFPDKMFPIEGFKGIHDNPNVRVLIIESNIKFVMVSIEIVMLSDELIQLCKEKVNKLTGAAKDNVWIHVTHAITTPHSPGGPLLGLGGDSVVLSPEETERREKIAYQKEIYSNAIMTALDEAIQAASKTTDAIMKVGYGDCNLIIGRDIKTKNGWWIGKGDEDFSNQRMTIVSFENALNQLIGGLISYGMKPCVIDNSEMQNNGRLVSSDAPGLMCKVLEERHGGSFLYFTAAAGDRIPVKTVFYDEEATDGTVHTVDLGIEKGFEFVNEIGLEMAQTADDILASSTISYETETGETMADEAATAESKTNYLMTSKTSTFLWQTKKRCEMHPYTSLDFEAEAEKEVTVNTLTIGNVAFVAGKPEINVTTESELSQESNYEHTLYLSMVDGGMKYMPDLKAYSELRWEALTSMLMPGAAEEFVKTATKLLNE